ncbi:MAG: peptide-methionine (S)-S-oxide reductase MsrA [Bacteroidetes bacterium]|nr:peptide-methionine (S)-S-oxide reductase MsrA [Bacteroidota bacterium]
MKYIKTLFLISCVTLACNSQPAKKMNMDNNSNKMKTNMDTATFGAGCFWCVEAVFQQLQGVDTVISGYAGGSVKNPSYKEVCSGETGHAEVCQIIYDAKQISYEELCQVFFQAHDPTQLNKQGNDEGTQYRSVIFYNNEQERDVAEKVKKELDMSGILSSKVVTEISPLTIFYPAEDYHQNYFNLNKDKNPYCTYVIIPKLEKFKKTFHDKLKR